MPGRAVNVALNLASFLRGNDSRQEWQTSTRDKPKLHSSLSTLNHTLTTTALPSSTSPTDSTGTA